MKKTLLTFIVMLFGLAGVVNAQSVKTPGIKNTTSGDATAFVAAPKTNLLAMVTADKKKPAETATTKAAALPIVCYHYTLTTNQGFSTTYQWTECNGVVRTQHLDVGQSTTVCAQDGTVSGGPYTKGTVCQ